VNDRRINPEHPVSEWAEDNWQSVMAMLMWKAGVDEVRLTMEDIERYQETHPEPMAVVIDSRVEENVMVVQLTTRAEGERRARAEAGR